MRPAKSFALAAACVVLLGAAPPQRDDARSSHAIRRALDFVYRSASDPANFRADGDDYVWCFYTIAHTARDPGLARAALTMGRERARAWRREHRGVPRNATADDVSALVSGALGADLLGLRDERFKAQLRRAARRFTARDFLRFDPATEAPPSDVPDCAGCTAFASRYEIFMDALIVTYFGDAYGIRLGASYRDVVRWLPRMRPYPAPPNDFSDAFFAVAHVVYTLNGYGARRIAPRLLPAEVAVLERGLAAGIARHDAEMVGEALDSLKAFGFGANAPLMRRGAAYLLASQRADGTWGGGADVYTRYHSAWTGIDGLRGYRFGPPTRRRFAEVPGA